MKVFVLGFILAVVELSRQQAPSTPDGAEAAAMDCMKESNADATVVQKALSEGVFAEDNDLKCFIKCMFIKMGDMTESGQLVLDSMLKQAPPQVTQAQATQIVNACKDSAGTDQCDIAFNAAKCIVQQTAQVLGS